MNEHTVHGFYLVRPPGVLRQGCVLALHLPSFAVTLRAPLTVGSLLRARHSINGPLKAHHPDKEMALEWSSDTTTFSTYPWLRNKPLQDFMSQNSEHVIPDRTSGGTWWGE